MSGKIFGKDGAISFLCNPTAAICVSANQIGSSKRKRRNIHPDEGAETIQDKGGAKNRNPEKIIFVGSYMIDCTYQTFLNISGRKSKVQYYNMKR